MNVTGRWVVPGLIDGHVHLDGTGTPGRDEAEHTDPARARPRMEEHLAHGVTTMADLFGHPPAMFARRAMVRLRPTPRALAPAAGERTRSCAGAARRILAAALDGRLAAAVSAGLRVAAGTDAGNNHTPHGWSLHRELHLLRTAGLTGGQVLAAATSVAADELGRGGTGIGRIAVGGPADLLVLAEDPRHDTEALARPEHIVAAGRVI
jgi:imidazolonepropionase-like amidohydrolase